MTIPPPDLQQVAAQPARQPSSSPQAFTLIELLVVITIIAVLAGLLLPVASKVMVNAQKTSAASTENQIVLAVKAFQTEYGKYPIPASYPPNQVVCFGDQPPTVAKLFDILRANGQGEESSDTTRVNTRKIVYIELPSAKNQTSGQSKNGLGSDGKLYDPWGKIYLVGVDGKYEGSINNPYRSGAGFNPLGLGVIVYSYGPDTDSDSDFYGPGGDKNNAKNKDDVISWQ